MKKIISFFTCLLFLVFASSYGQSHIPTPYGNRVTIKTDYKNFRGELYETTDSGVSIFKRRQDKIMQVPFYNINRIVIKSKAPLSLEILKTTLIGALAADLFISYIYLRNLSLWPNNYPNEPSFGKALLYGLPIGAVFGLGYQTYQAIFVRIRIPLNKSLHLFEVRRSLLGIKSIYTSY